MVKTKVLSKRRGVIKYPLKQSWEIEAREIS